METLTALDVLLRLLVAGAAGMVIGLERERLEKAAGLRTLALVSSGSAVFVLAALLGSPAEAVRMAAGIATGVGFLGAGAILRDQGEVLGLTTAATVWVAAALGIAAALGEMVLVVVGAALTLFVLTVLGHVDLRRVQQDARTYEIAYAHSDWDEPAAAACLRDAGLRVALLSVSRTDQGIVAAWRAVGRRHEHERGLACLQAAADVTAFSVKA